ncbi:MAG: NADH-quinone oxidoreductase subunit L, partial [Proteobacteria bacterium]|nr:NADH-quinone oxidoreductase subunit L [Pseudomonadota bacterium]
VDELYNFIIVKPLSFLASILFLVFDRAMIDGTVNTTGQIVDVSHDILKGFHTGKIGFYALMMFSASIFFTIFCLLN